MATHLWARLTWKEIRDAAGQNPVVIIPVGTVETQGPYNIVGLETLIVERLASEVARKTSSLALPSIPFGYSDSFADIPGTIHVRPEVLQGLYYDVADSILRHGFDHLFFLTAHAPNQPLMRHVFHRLRVERGILAASMNPGRIAPAYIKDLFDEPLEARGHGAEPGLSIGEYLAPEDVSREEARPSKPLNQFRGFDVKGTSAKFQGFDVLMRLSMSDVAPETCGYGDPTQGSAELGKVMFERMVDVLCGFVHKFQEMDTHI
jgi:creatinine amidohydrolase